jgi:hypothetical protein
MRGDVIALPPALVDAVTFDKTRRIRIKRVPGGGNARWSAIRTIEPMTKPMMGYSVMRSTRRSRPDLGARRLLMRAADEC